MNQLLEKIDSMICGLNYDLDFIDDLEIRKSIMGEITILQRIHADLCWNLEKKIK